MKEVQNNNIFFGRKGSWSRGNSNILGKVRPFFRFVYVRDKERNVDI